MRRFATIPILLLFLAGCAAEEEAAPQVATTLLEDPTGTAAAELFFAEGAATVDDPERAIAERQPFSTEDASLNLDLKQLLDNAPQPTRDDVTVLLTEQSSLPAAVNAVASGAPVELLQSGDPRESARVMADPAAPVVAIQPGFDDFERRLELAQHGEVPGGGGLIFPDRRLVALYGHPSGPALGMLGEQSPQESVERVQKLVGEYQEVAGEERVMPAFEIIATVASGSPGPDGDFSNETSVEELRPYVDAIGEAGGYAVLDLQPGRANFLDQAKRYEELLRLPHVGLALDPEWRIGPDELPMQRVGSVQAAEVNEVSEWLVDVIKQHKLPQKLMVLHQFQLGMLPDRELIDTKQPELAWVLHADGHGTAEEKFATWDAMRRDLQPEMFLAWKNFHDEDTPMFTPRRTYEEVSPRPWFVSYQ